jgi:multidrug efflux pump subunit AcrB
MRNIIAFFIKRPIWGNSLIAIVLLFGLFSIFTMKRSFFPEMDPNTIVVSVFYPGASPSEMEEGVTIKVEQAVKGLSEIEEINSTSNENMATVTIKAYTDTDMDELLSDVENTINSINSFPQGAERPIITRIKSGGMGSVVAFVGVSAKKTGISDIALIDVASKVERELLNTKQITQIQKNGFPTKEISVNVRENDLLRYGVSIQEVAQAIGSKNIDLTAGLIRGGVQEMSVRANDRGVTENEIKAIPLRSTSTGESVLIGDVADVVLGYSEDSQESRFNNKPAVAFRIEKTVEQDIAKISDALHVYQEKFNAENPNFQFDIYYEFNGMLNDRISLLTSNGISGLVLVLIFLGLFLNLKLSAWVAFGIPFSFLGMFILGMGYGMTINMISLFGMILVVGILVDDGIVIAENIYAHFERGKSPQKAAIDGTMEVLPSVFSSVITTIVAFSLLFFVEGLEMMREMAFVAIACLVFSLVEAFLILPAHLAHKNILQENTKPSFSAWKGLAFVGMGILIVIIGGWLFPQNSPSFGTILFPFTLFILGAILCLKGFSNSPLELWIRGGADKGIKYVRDNWFKESVLMILGTKRKWYRASFFLPLIFTITSFALLIKGTISATFFPNIPPDFFSVEAAYNPGDNKAQTQQFIDVATKILLEENERIALENGDSMMTYFSSTIGFTQNLGQAGNHTGALNVFVDVENSKTPLDTFMNRIISRLQELPEGKLAQDLYVGGFNRFGKEIEVGLTSQVEENLLEARKIFKKNLSDMNGVINIKDNMPPGRNEVVIKMKPQAEIVGIAKGDVLNQIRQGFFGQEAQRVIIGTDEVKIWVRYPKEDRNSLMDLENMKIKNNAGVAIPLHEICTFEIGRAPESLKRRNGQRIIKVDAESSDPDLVASINQSIFDSIIPKISSIYPDVQAVKLGQFERSQKTGNSMQYVIIICLILMFIIISLHFNSLSQAFLILLVVPAGLAGAILGHGLVGIPVSLLSVFGMIALLGVLVNDAIVFLDRYNDLLLLGNTPRQAALEAATSRFRPILLTSLTTVAGLLPLIAEKSMQAQFLIPMATSIAFGVLFGTIFILFFYPAAILFWNDRARLGKMIWRWEKVDALEVEPVLKLQKKINEIENTI